MAELITKIDLYNAPYEINSVDRFYKDIDNKLANYKAGDVKEFSWTTTSTTDMVLTIGEGTKKRGSYARIESSIFANTKVSYWFLTEISGIESVEDTQYKAKLDAIATFGEEVFEKLDGNKIKIDRLHEDRYTFENTVFNLNKKHHGLINTDFKLGDTKGMELVYDGSNDEKSGRDGQAYNVPWTIENTALAGQIAGITLKDAPARGEIDNVISVGDKSYYLYAMIQVKGSPEIFDSAKYIREIDTNEILFAPDTNHIKTAIRRSVLAPVSISPTSQNNIQVIEALQEGKVLNIIKLPYKIPEEDAFTIYFGADGKRVTKAERFDSGGNLVGNPFLMFADGVTVLTESYTVTEDVSVKFESRTIFPLYPLICFKNITSYNDEDIVSIPTSKLNEKDIMDFIANTKTPAEMKRIIDGGQSERLEIALLNPEIMPIEMHFHDNKTILDFYNFANKADRTKINGSYVFNEMGLEVTLEISENQYAGWSENTIMSFATDQGATYLARHKYTNDAQKKSIDLSAQQAGLQAHMQKLSGRDQAGNIVSGIMSLGASTAAGAHQADYAGQIEALQPKIADAKKAEIQGTINDASATSPSMHIGSSHNLINLNIQELKHNFNWIMKKPNKILRDKIVNFYDRHGYSFKDWIVFKKEMLENRSRFNFIEMSEFKDFIGTFADFDINVLQLLDAEFKKGLRLWHENIINYNEPNLEIVIKENIANA